MIVLALLILTVVTLAVLTFVLGFRLGGEHWQARLTQVRLDAARAERELHNLTRNAFVAMTEVAQERRKGHDQ
jgi:hypothetical protein